MNRGFLGAVLVVLACAGSALAGPEQDGSMRLWIDADYLLWWIRDAPAPVPLLTTGPLTVPPQAGSGILGNQGTQILVGDNTINQPPFSGFRVSAGWIRCDDAFGFDGNFFYLGQMTRQLTFQSNASGSPLLARPVIDARTGMETALLASAPGAFSGVPGSVRIASTTQLYGADANFILPIERMCDLDEFDNLHCHYFHLIAGPRYLNLMEDLNIGQLTNVLTNGIGFFNGLPYTAPSTIGVYDNFHTLNQFYGGQVGAQVGFEWWRLTLNAAGKLAFGTVHEQVDINGITTLNSPSNPPQSVPGGLLALQSNMGSYTRNRFAFLPEGNLSLSFEITPQIKLTIGYTILYITNVVRPGNQIDPSINRTLLPTSQSYNPAQPGPNHPGFRWNDGDFWAQGINIGLGFRF